MAKAHTSERPKWPELISVSLAWSMPRNIATPPWTGHWSIAGYSTANDRQPQMIPRPQIIPKMDRKWSRENLRNGMDFMGLIAKKGLIIKQGTFFSCLLKKKGRRTLHLRSIYTRRKKSRINLKRIWYQPYSSSFVNCFNFLSRTVSSLKI